ncbi:hypothetical protein LX90_002725 [Lentzea flava]|nr:hypothetical protein [Lentzea flava]
MIAVVAVGAPLLHVPAAHAVPGCSAAYEEYNQSTQRGSGASTCSDGVQRLMLTCHDMMGGVVYTVYGNWAGPGATSRASCDTYGRAIGASATR